MYGYRFPYWTPTFIKRTFFLRGLRMKIQRAIRGYNDEDLWSFDSYLKGVISKGLRQLATTTHSYPGGEEWTYEKWQEFLIEIADDLDAWNEDTFVNEESYIRAQNAMHRVAEHFGELWD